jgi:hypothetical protein
MLVLTWSFLVMLLALAGGCSSKTLTAVEVTPATVSLAVSATQQYAAKATYSDDSTEDVTDKVVWASSDDKIATIDAKGLATGVAAGSASISAELTDGDTTMKGTASLTVAAAGVTLKSIAVTPGAPSIANGTTTQFTATGTYSDDSTKDVTAQVTWTSSDDKVATIAANGLATAAGAGMADITAKLDQVSGTAKLTVTTATLEAIEVTSADAWLPKGMKEQFTATGIFSDLTKQDLTKLAMWASSEPVMTISNNDADRGVATAAAEGKTVITATFMGVSGSAEFQVTGATLAGVAVTPFNPTIAKGTKLAFYATAIFSDNSLMNVTPLVMWKSSDTTIATISGESFEQGIATGVSAGMVKISATLAGKTGDTTLTVTVATLDKVDIVPVNPSLPKGGRLELLAIGTFSDKSARDLTPWVTWGSSDPTVATVSNAPYQQGHVAALQQGTTTVSASIAGKSDSTKLTVTPAVLSSIAISPVFPSIAKGTSIQLYATGVYSDKTTQDLTKLVTWSSSDASVSIANAPGGEGVATGVDMGQSTIKATLDGVNGSTVLTVTAATLSSIQVTPANPSIAKGTRVQLYATGIYSDNSVQDLTHWVTWSSSDASVAVSNAFATHGLAMGLVEGESTVTATFMGGKSGETTVKVTAATLVSLSVKPQHPSIAKGTTVWLRAMGVYTDNSMQDLTDQASWISSDPAVSVSNYPDFGGVAVGVAQGSASVTATFGDKSDSTTVTVTAATLSYIAINPASLTLAKGTASWLAATGTFSDSSTQDLTALVTWTSADETKALVSNATDSHGLVTAVSPGSVVITASFAGKTATADVNVTAATLASITVMPANATVTVGGTKQFSAVGTFSDNSMQDLTAWVVWTSSSPDKAIISNVPGSKGLATGVSSGSTTIAAWLAGKSGSVPLTVAP